MKVSANVSPQVNRANTIQYIIHFTCTTNSYRYFPLKLLNQNCTQNARHISTLYIVKTVSQLLYRRTKGLEIKCVTANL